MKFICFIWKFLCIYFEWIGVFHAGVCRKRFTIVFTKYGDVLLFERGYFRYWKERLRAFVFNCQRWNSLISWGRTTAKASAKDVSVDQERKLGDRRWLDTVVVLTINFAIQELDWCYSPFQYFLRNHKSLSSGGSIVARPKLKGIDGRAPPGVELAA